MNVKKNVIINSCSFKGIREIEWNKTIFQSGHSISCGQYVLYFLFERLFNQDMSYKDLLDEIFVENIEKNEQKVEEFYSEFLTTHSS